MAVTVQATATGSQVAGTSVSVNKPAAVQRGDLLILFLAKDSDDNVTTGPSGFVYDAEMSDALGVSTGEGRFWTKIAGASEPSSYSVSWAGNEAALLHIAVIRGQAASWKDVAGKTYSTGNVTDVTIASLTVAEDGSLVYICAVGEDGDATSTITESGWTDEEDTTIGSSTSGALCVAYSKAFDAGATGSMQINHTTDQELGAGAIVIKPDTGSPAPTIRNAVMY